MKHRYNPLVLVIVFISLALLSFSVFYFFPEFVEAHSKGRKGLDSLLVALPIAITSLMMINNVSSNVETMNEYVKFNNFRLKAFNVFKTFSITLGYGSVVSIEAKKLPVVGIYKIIVTSKNYPDPIPVSRFFLKHKQLFYDIATQAKRFNPDVFLNEAMQKFLDKS